VGQWSAISSREKEGYGGQPQSKFTPQFSQMMMGQYWLGKAQTSFQDTFKKVATELF